MIETQRTLIYVGTAAVLVVIAWLLSPRTIVPDSFADVGEPFFPEFSDPNTALSMEVIEWDNATASARPFKVAFESGQWVIPSHNDYPADAADRLARTAAGVIDIVRDDFRSDSPNDYAAMGVIDPLDEVATGVTGRGQRVTIRGANDVTLADLIIGNPIPERPGFRFVREPEARRVFASRINVDISTRFSDWIVPDLLKIDKDDINRLTMNNYRIDERTGSVRQGERIVLGKREGEWRFDGSGQPDSANVEDLLTAIDDVVIVGVRPKPSGLTDVLTGQADQQRISQSDWLDLQSKGFYLSRDGQLLSNEGELIVETATGLRYTLRFGEVLYGTGLAITAGSGSSADQASQSGDGEGRYLFVSVQHDPVLMPGPPRPTNMAFLSKPDSLLTDPDRENAVRNSRLEDHQKKLAASADLANELNRRFADWYYVISSVDFERLRRDRTSL